MSGSRQDLIPSYSLGSNKGRWESQQDVSQTTVSRGIAPAPALSVSPQNNHSPDPGLSNLAASYLNPVKSFVPQMPKLLKSLFPVRDEKRGKRPSPLAHQAQPEMGPDVLVQTMGAPALKICDKPAKVPSPPPVIAVTAVTPAPEAQDGPPSPLSEASSGYFSHSVSTATLSDALGPGLDAAAPPGSMPTAPEAEPEAPISHPPPPTAVPAEEPPGPQQLVSPGRERPDLEAPAPGSPFRVRRVRASELRSFSRMLAGDPGCSPGAEGNAPAPGAGGQALASDSEEADEVPEWLREGEFVTVGAHKTGVVRYVGPADFQEGTWVGVELDLPSGKNDGSIGGKQYFRCNPGYGLLVRPSRVRRATGPVRRRSTGLRLGAPEARRSATLSGSATNLASLTAALAKADRSHKNPENRKSWAS
ncbi:kinesin family member 13B [Homo sapiens]|nr:kinesin family member 13B [Homo sapiens]KAI4010146.1 kinesin family member 13B [Homo sapiens]